MSIPEPVCERVSVPIRVIVPDTAAPVRHVVAIGKPADKLAAKAGGKRLGNNGYFYEPTVITGVPLTARIMNEEPFGPVAAMRAFDDRA